MRRTGPVTQRELPLTDDSPLVSTTDLQSRITYANPAFVAVSGYGLDELVGQPHNLIRHPDMPPEAFRDMWETLRAGEPWTAIVKNRCKNGDHFGVPVLSLPFAAWSHHQREAGLQRVALTAERMAAGDLTAPPDIACQGAMGRLLRALNQLRVNLQAVVGDVRQEAEGVHLACREIANAGMDLGQRTEQQAGSLQQAAAALEQIAAVVRHTADGAQQAGGLAKDTMAAARRTGEAGRAAGQRMDGLRQSSQRIAEIVGVIEGLSFRTNLLALNAAVEAARAGAAGSGFAVAAAEVRALAQRSSEAAGQIRGLIRDSQDQVDLGVRSVAETGGAAQQAETAVEAMGALIDRIGAAVLQQSGGVGEVNASVSAIDALTQHNAALVEELSAAAGQLAQRAEVVVQAVRVFRSGRAEAVTPR